MSDRRPCDHGHRAGACPVCDRGDMGAILRAFTKPDPRDARIAALEAALREARGYVLAYDHCDEAGEVLRQSLIARIAALLAKPGAG